MAILITGMALFFLVHLVPLAPQTRAALVGRLGARGYQAAFSLVSAVGLGLMVWGYWISRAGPAAADMVYGPPEGPAVRPWRWFFSPCSPSASICTRAGSKCGWKFNETAIAPCGPPGISFQTAACWSVLLFGGFLTYALIDISADTDRDRCRPSLPTPATTMWRCSRARCCSHFSCSSSTPMCSTCLSFDEARGHWSCGAAPQHIG